LLNICLASSKENFISKEYVRLNLWKLIPEELWNLHKISKYSIIKEVKKMVILHDILNLDLTHLLKWALEIRFTGHI
jgi:hypothetical protein